MSKLTPDQLSDAVVAIKDQVTEIARRLPPGAAAPATATASGGQASTATAPAAEHAHGDACPSCVKQIETAQKKGTEALGHAADGAGLAPEADRLSDAYQKWADAGFPAGKQDALDSLAGVKASG